MGLKLYVWESFAPDYSDGLAVAIASSVEEARELVIEDMGYNPQHWGAVEVYPIEPIAFGLAGGS